MRILFVDKMILQTNLKLNINYVILIEFLSQFRYCEFVLIETLLLSVNIIYVVDWLDMIFFFFLFCIFIIVGLVNITLEAIILFDIT